jgi:predicted nucleotide-binding protein (sugar kinase/HSP70/actin superfamily)
MSETTEKEPRFADNFKYLITGDGKKIRFNDPNLVHIWSFDDMPYFSEMLRNSFDKRGWRYRSAERISHKSLQDAKKVCSGKECLACLGFARAVYSDIIKNRGKDEFSMYYYIDQAGPCQNAAWPDMWKIFAKRLGVENALFQAFPGITNNFLGQGNMFGLELSAATILSDIFHEAENTLKCLAKDREEAVSVFKTETGKVMKRMKKGLYFVEPALMLWARRISRIPLRASVAETPKVLIFGTPEVEVIHYPVTEYFINHGIIPKTQDMSAYAYRFAGELFLRNAFRNGRILVRDQIKILPFLLSLFNPKIKFSKAFNAGRAYVSAVSVDVQRKRYHWIARKSGLLLSDKCPSLFNLSLKANEVVSANTITETYPAVGEYVHNCDSKIYDGMMHICTVNCQPALNAQAIIRALAGEKEIPYADIDMEGPWISAGQTKILEAMTLQARRYRAQR